MNLFKGLGNLGNLGSLMKQAQQMSGRMQEITARMKEQRVTGSSGGGMIEAEVNGVGDLLRVTIESNLVQSGDREMIENLIPAAVNQALAKARALHGEAMKELTGGLDIPGLNEAMGNLPDNEDG